jgi:hypothetical protein
LPVRRIPIPAALVTAIAAGLLLSAANFARATGSETAVPVLHGREMGRYEAPEAFQGAAADARSFYAIDSARIARYDKATGRKLASWSDRNGAIVHLNSCAVRERLLLCAHSDYPATPARNSVELFDAATLKHVGHRDLGTAPGALTWADRHDGAWWLCFAVYGGAGLRSGAATMLVRYDEHWRRRRAWRFPESVLHAFGSMSASGGAWGPDGYLYVMGHDRPELYVLRLPRSGSVLEHVATVIVPGHGQAFGWDPSAPRTLYSVDRSRREVIVTRVPPIPN